MADKIIRIKRENREQAIGVARERGEQDVLLAPERVVIRSTNLEIEAIINSVA